MKRTSFTLERTFDAPVARVYEAWTEPKDLARWLWASLGKDAWAEVDLRAGGAYRVYTNFPGGRHRGEGWSGMCGIYVDVQPGRRLAFTLHWDADVGYNTPDALTLDEVVVVDFEGDGDKTHLTMRHLGIPDDGKSALTHKQGVAESLDMLAALLAE
jgi:uncharacterized protein YndB with AHSA1/START domain